ncbi:MAG: hypothetical protein OEV21_06850 [Thermoplasmata archaeon]|nr:hypothetical protein [Thermoplasmata archaeon]
MNERFDMKKVIKLIRLEAKSKQPVLAVIKSAKNRSGLKKLASEFSTELGGSVIRSAYTPNSEIALFEIRSNDLVLVLLTLKGENEAIMAVDKTTDQEIAEIESNLYSSNINDVYVRLVSDIF